MTKEISKEWLIKQFVKIADSYSSNSAILGMYKQIVDEATLIADEFFSQNVVIPKDAEVQGLVSGEWIDLNAYRIKPQEQAYEWKWECFKEEGVSFISNVYMTEGEANMISIKLLKIEETRRERK